MKVILIKFLPPEVEKISSQKTFNLIFSELTFWTILNWMTIWLIICLFGCYFCFQRAKFRMWWNSIHVIRVHVSFNWIHNGKGRGEMVERVVVSCNRSWIAPWTPTPTVCGDAIFAVSFSFLLKTIYSTVHRVFYFSTFSFSFVSFDVLKQTPLCVVVYSLMNNWTNENASDKWHVLYKMIAKLKQKWFINAMISTHHHWHLTQCANSSAFLCWKNWKHPKEIDLLQKQQKKNLMNLPHFHSHSFNFRLNSICTCGALV